MIASLVPRSAHSKAWERGWPAGTIIIHVEYVRTYVRTYCARAPAYRQRGAKMVSIDVDATQCYKHINKQKFTEDLHHRLRLRPVEKLRECDLYCS